MLMRACADCILASIVSRSAFSLRISVCTESSEVLAESASFLRRLHLRLHVGDVVGELILLLDEDDGEIVLVRRDGGVQLGLGLRELLRGGLIALVDLLAAPDDGGRGALETRVLRRPSS